jgi:uroporphyrinogen-III decarboxylase
VDALGDKGLVAFFGIRSPLQVFVEELAGQETGLYLLHDHPDAVESLFDAIHQKNKEAFQIVAESAFEFVICVENTSTTTISPRMFEKHVVPCLNEYAAILHGASKIVGVHACGHLKGMVGGLRKLDVDGLESVSPPPTGSIELPEAVAKLGDRFFIIGGIAAPPLVWQSPDEVYDSVTSMLSRLPSKRGIVLQVADDVSPWTPLDNLRAVGRAVEAFG